MQSQQFDSVVVGSGLAGLTFALKAAENGNVIVLTKAAITESNTYYAQGGIAAAIGDTDSWELHEQDTLTAGGGVNDAGAVRKLVQSAPGAIQWLQTLGANFDTSESNSLALGREGGHSRHRIVHFADRTGWEVEGRVSQAVKEHPNIRVVEHAFVTEILMADGRAVGVAAMIDEIGLRAYYAPTVMIATGGCGKVYENTTNPRVATGDGIALASRVGAQISGMEFMQFHPTCLYHPQMPNFLLTEALRGSGATLRNHRGRRFLYDYLDDLELAPRDAVARAIASEIVKQDTWCVYLDCTHMEAHLLETEFPTIWHTLRKVGLEMEKEWIPVVPAQHYCCGGIATDLDGRTTIPGLYAAGEVAHTGVHGANRLASNSLLEAIIFSVAAAEVCTSEPAVASFPEPTPVHCIHETDAISIRHQLQTSMSKHAGIFRTDSGLEKATQVVAKLTAEYEAGAHSAFSSYAAEAENLLSVACHILEAAKARRQNIGLHFNADLQESAS